LEPVQIAALMKAARARALVTLAAMPGFDVVTKLAPALDGLPDLKIARWRTRRSTLQEQNRDRRASPSPRSPVSRSSG
jgi:hypothetical protein